MGAPKKKIPLAGIVAISSFVTGFIIIFYGINNKTPVVPLIGFCVAFVGVVVASIIQGASKKNSSGYSGGAPKATLSGSVQKYVPVLADERTKQDPDVQRLLQYTSVQKAFFNPAYLDTAEARNDPNVRELLGVLDNIILERTAGGAYLPSAQGGVNDVSDLERERMQDEIERRKKEKNKPRRIAGTIIMCVGLALFIVPFSIVFISAMNGSEFAGKMSAFLFSAAPFGMMLTVAGSIIGKR